MRITIGELRRIIRETVEQMGDPKEMALDALRKELEARPGNYFMGRAYTGGDKMDFHAQSGGYKPLHFKWDGSEWVEAGRPSVGGYAAPASRDPQYLEDIEAREFQRGGHGVYKY